jgi:hypothetical protein
MKLGTNQEAYVEELETTRKKQCYRTLYDDDGACCVLGIAADGRNDGWIHYLQDKLLLHAAGRKRLIHFNDVERMSFGQIACEIRENPLAFFEEPR